MSDKNRKRCMNVKTGEKFRSVKELADSLHRDISVVAKACKNGYKTAGVYVTYLDEKDV